MAEIMNNGIVDSSFLKDQKRPTGFATARELPSTSAQDSSGKDNSQTRISSHQALK